MHLVVADDHPIVRGGLVALLTGSIPDLEITEVNSAKAAIDVCRAHPVDVVLLDVEFTTHPLRGSEALPQFASLRPAPTVLLLTTFSVEADFLLALNNDAGYLLKGADPSALVSAVRQAANGEVTYSPEVMQRIAARAYGDVRALTSREHEVLEVLAKGLSNAEIARELFLAQATVKTHLRNIFDKLRVDNRGAAIAKAQATGLIRTPH